MKRIACFLCLALLLASTASSYAQVQTYFFDSSPRNLPALIAAEASFLSQFTVYGTDNYDSYPLVPGFPFGFTPPVLMLNGLATTYSTNAPLIGSDLGGFPLSVSPTQFLSSTSLDSTVLQNVSFTFSNSVSVFGIFVAQVGDAGNSTQLTITLQDGPGGNPRTYPIGNFSGRQFDDTFYFGIIDPTPFDRVTISSNNPNDGFTFDNLSVSAIPEPTTIALIAGMGLAGLGGYYFKRRRAMKGAQQRFRLVR